VIEESQSMTDEVTVDIARAVIDMLSPPTGRYYWANKIPEPQQGEAASNSPPEGKGNVE
jgi:hypothetical protein